MLRQILIVHPSEPVLRSLQKAINANISDAAVFTADSVQLAVETTKMFHIHLILLSPEFSREALSDLCNQLQPLAAEQSVPILLLTEGGSRQELESACELETVGTIDLACGANTLCQTIDQVCCPKRLRGAKRYSIPRTEITVCQSGCSLPGKVINISEGGLLCQLEAPGGFEWAKPAILNLHFNISGKVLAIQKLRGASVNLNVVRANPDESPAVIRVAFRFIEPAEESLVQLSDIFSLYGAEEDAL